MLVSLTVDGEFLYWISKAEDSTQIYQAKKSNGAILSQVEAPRSKHILVYSSVLQPFPGRKVTVFISLFPQFRVREISSCLLLQGSPSSPSLCSQHCSRGQGLGHTAIAVCPGSQFISVYSWLGLWQATLDVGNPCPVSLCSLSLLSHITSLLFVLCFP